MFAKQNLTKIPQTVENKQINKLAQVSEFKTNNLRKAQNVVQMGIHSQIFEENYVAAEGKDDILFKKFEVRVMFKNQKIKEEKDLDFFQIKKLLLHQKNAYFICQHDLSVAKEGLYLSLNNALQENQHLCLSALGELCDKIIQKSKQTKQQIQQHLNQIEDDAEQTIKKLPSAKEDANCIILGGIKFQKGAYLGEGAYGSVFLVQNHQGVFALKKMGKQKANFMDILVEIVVPISLDQIDQVAQLYGAFQDQNFVYFLTEFCNGGTLEKYLKDKGPMSKQSAVQYGTDILIALEAMHKKGFVYRDLKSNNIVLHKKSNGEIIAKLIDFGFSKYLNENDFTNSDCCAIINKAPEIIYNQFYGKSLDFYSFGYILFQMLTTQIPYLQTQKHINKQIVFDSIRHGQLRFPMGISANAIDLCKQLLEKNQENRLNDWGKVKQHPFFANTEKKRLSKYRSLSPRENKKFVQSKHL